VVVVEILDFQCFAPGSRPKSAARPTPVVVSDHSLKREYLPPEVLAKTFEVVRARKRESSFSWREINHCNQDWDLPNIKRETSTDPRETPSTRMKFGGD